MPISNPALKAGLENDCYYVFHLDVVDKYSHTIIESFSSKSLFILKGEGYTNDVLINSVSNYLLLSSGYA